MLSEIFSRPLKREQTDGITPEQSRITRFMEALKFRIEKFPQLRSESGDVPEVQNIPREVC